jgi:hypothetical protein
MKAVHAYLVFMLPLSLFICPLVYKSHRVVYNLSSLAFSSNNAILGIYQLLYTTLSRQYPLWNCSEQPHPVALCYRVSRKIFLLFEFILVPAGEYNCHVHINISVPRFK